MTAFAIILDKLWRRVAGRRFPKLCTSGTQPTKCIARICESEQALSFRVEALDSVLMVGKFYWQEPFHVQAPHGFERYLVDAAEVRRSQAALVRGINSIWGS